MKFPTLIYSWLAKSLMTLSQMLGKGSGTSLGGLVSELYKPDIVSYFQGKYKKIIFISGTNGKTTTRSLINHFLEQDGLSVCSNRGGANIFRGIVSSLVSDLTITGVVKSEYLVLEVEEATLPKLTPYLKPDILVLTNIFRDQLDAYGEIDKTLEFFSNTIESCRPQVIANADDAKLLQAISPVTNDIVGFRVDSPEQIKFEPTDKHSSLIIDDMVTVTLQKDGSLNVAVPSLINKIFTAYTQLPGTYNLYNVAAAIATCSQILDTYNYISTLNTYKPAFGRGEEIQLMHSTIHLFLVKNPAGYDSVLQHIARSFDEQQLHMVFALNDKIADGKDVSWIWDVEFEPFFESFTPTKTHTLGTRAYDMLLRLQYANAEVTIHQGDYSIANLVDSIKHDKESQHITILATYTALLSIRKELSKLIPTYTNNINKQGN